MASVHISKTHHGQNKKLTGRTQHRAGTERGSSRRHPEAVRRTPPMSTPAYDPGQPPPQTPPRYPIRPLMTETFYRSTLT